MADIAKEYLESSVDTSYINPNHLDTQGTLQESESVITNSSSYVLARDDSHLSREVDRWIRGSADSNVNGIQNCRPPLIQRSTLTSRDSRLGSSFWYIAALLLPLFSANNSHWRCSPSAMLNTAELLVVQMGRACSRVRYHIQRLARNQVSRDICATAMDIVLVVYAVGFLILSMYQAALIG
ncbi:uncharacterized protein LOC119839451 [Zerene cesonia]|uniref:uncharacterized protein LOC119839451 n=1 Tax=Zerene cesonia TaxID=33412 RepID=UPI0018E56D1A|nr:uncharacterized protein LOC119839451 [Zerene cesonia]